MDQNIETIVEAITTQAVCGINAASKKTNRDIHIIPNSMEIDIAFTLEYSAGGGISISIVKLGADVKGTTLHRVKFGVYASSETHDVVEKRRDELKKLSEQYQR